VHAGGADQHETTNVRAVPIEKGADARIARALARRRREIDDRGTVGPGVGPAFRMIEVEGEHAGAERRGGLGTGGAARDRDALHPRRTVAGQHSPADIAAADNPGTLQNGITTLLVIGPGRTCARHRENSAASAAHASTVRRATDSKPPRPPGRNTTPAASPG